MKYKALSRILSILLVVFLIAGTAACTSKNKEEEGSASVSSAPAQTETEADKGWSVAYNSGDPLNPFTSKTKLNHNLVTLLYDQLVKLNESFVPEMALASDVSLDGTSCIITLREASFSDGTAVTAGDVAYSLERAMDEESVYAARLQNVAWVTTLADGTVSVSLAEEDPYFINLLDIPIIKEGTEELTNADSKPLPPTGSGRYMYTENGDAPYLAANPNWRGGAVPVEQISLIDAPDSVSLRHNLESGAVSLYYSDLSDGVTRGTSGKYLSVSLNNLVYVGVNCDNGVLADSGIRRALSQAVSRQDIVNNAYFGFASPVGSPCNPAWQEAGSIPEAAAQNLQEAVAQMEAAGYNTKDEEGYYSADSGRLSLRITYNSEDDQKRVAAEQVVEDLASLGVEITLVPLSFEEYSAALQSGDFDLYLGEVEFSGNMDLSPVLTEGEAVYGMPRDSLALESYQLWRQGEGSPDSFMSSFTEEMPFIPLCYRQGEVAYPSTSDGTLRPTVSDPYMDMETLSN